MPLKLIEKWSLRSNLSSKPDDMSSIAETVTTTTTRQAACGTTVRSVMDMAG